MASTMQLEFSQAMSDFKTMFPDMDRDVIEAVLRANQGAVDATIDQLLQMSTDNQNEKLRNELDGHSIPSSPTQNHHQHKNLMNLDGMEMLNDNIKKSVTTGHLIDVRSDEIDDSNSDQLTTTAPGAAGVATAVLLNLNTNKKSNSKSDCVASPSQYQSTGASPKIRPLQQLQTTKTVQDSVAKEYGRSTTLNARWNPPMLLPLPENFLRIAPLNVTSNNIPLPYDGTREFDLPDEQFAMMLQNEEFMNQLRWNQEFMNTLDREQCSKSKGEDDAAFKERLKNMGKLSRKKFLQVARVFTWQRNKKVTTAKQIDSLPLKEEPSDDEDHYNHNQQRPFTTQTYTDSQVHSTNIQQQQQQPEQHQQRK